MKQITVTFEKTFQLRDDQDPAEATNCWVRDLGVTLVSVRPAETCTRLAPHVCTVNGPCNGFPKTADSRGQADKDRLSWKGH